jgi:hypothetical protein
MIRGITSTRKWTYYLLNSKKNKLRYLVYYSHWTGVGVDVLSKPRNESKDISNSSGAE